MFAFEHANVNIYELNNEFIAKLITESFVLETYSEKYLGHKRKPDTIGLLSTVSSVTGSSK